MFFLFKMDIKSYLPCKKPRRSNRLEVKEREEIKEKAIKEAPLGFFNIIPLELKFVVLRYLTGRVLNAVFNIIYLHPKYWDR